MRKKKEGEKERAEGRKGKVTSSILL